MGLRVRITLRHGCSSLRFVVCHVGSGLCDELIALLERIPTGVCVCVFKVCDLEPQVGGGLRPFWAEAPQKQNAFSLLRF